MMDLISTLNPVSPSTRNEDSYVNTLQFCDTATNSQVGAYVGSHNQTALLTGRTTSRALYFSVDLPVK